MPDVWLPGAYIDRGANAGYNAGRSSMRWCVEHYTVGSDSRNTGRTGYCHWLVHKDASRENGCTAYAPIDAITWHAGPWNGWGPGVEFERMTTGGMNAEGLSNADPLTDNQIVWGQRIVAFCAEWGIPVQLYDGPRYQADDLGWSGHINHQAIDDQRSDGLTRAEWDTIAGGGGAGPVPEPTAREVDKMFGCYLTWINWVDVYYGGTQVESYENGGPHNVFGIGPALSSLMESGVHVTTYTDENQYARLRDQIMAPNRAALAYLDTNR